MRTGYLSLYPAQEDQPWTEDLLAHLKRRSFLPQLYESDVRPDEIQTQADFQQRFRNLGNDFLIKQMLKNMLAPKGGI